MGKKRELPKDVIHDPLAETGSEKQDQLEKPVDSQDRHGASNQDDLRRQYLSLNDNRTNLIVLVFLAIGVIYSHHIYIMSEVERKLSEVCTCIYQVAKCWEALVRVNSGQCHLKCIYNFIHYIILMWLIYSLILSTLKHFTAFHVGMHACKICIFLNMLIWGIWLDSHYDTVFVHR